MAANSICVAVRIRPLSTKEAALLAPSNPNTAPVFSGDGSLAGTASVGSSSSSYKTPGTLRRVVRALDDRVLVFDPPEKALMVACQKKILGPTLKKEKDLRFCFDRVFDETATQEDVFQGSAKQLVTSVLDGFNATVFAYGATGCGKTHTISGSATEPGIIFLLAKEVFDRVAAKEAEMKCDVTLSYLEIYNENIRDLLIPNSPATLGLRESSGRVTVPGLSEQTPTSAQEVVSMILAANANRSVSATEANAVSSRSHAVLCLNVRQKPRTAAMSEVHSMATLSIIDLAGSERASVTKNRGDRLVEGANINRSLLALGNCINALCDVKRSVNHVPYRDSKLTRLLKHSLGGNCRTLMIVCVSPVHYDESFNTLQYANRAKSISTKISRNVVSVDRHVSQYVKVIYELRQELEGHKKQGAVSEKKWQEDYRKVKNKAWADIQDGIAALRKHYSEARVLVETASGAKLQLPVLLAAESALSDWRASAFDAHSLPDPIYTYPLENLAAELDRSRRTISSTVASAEAARSAFDKSCASTMRKYSNPLGAYATQFPEMLEAISRELRINELELDLASCSGRSTTIDKSSHMRSLHTAVQEVQSKVSTDLSICSEDNSDRKAFLQQLLLRMQSATSHIASSPMSFPQGAETIQSGAPGKKRGAGTRSPLLNASSTPQTDLPRPEKAQRPSLNVTSAATTSSYRSRPSTRGLGLSASVATLTNGAGRSSFKALTMSSKSSNGNTVGGTKKAEQKGVIWKDEAGEALTEEHSKSVINYSDASGYANTSQASSPRSSQSGQPHPTELQREDDESSTSQSQSDFSARVLAEIGNESIASSAANTSTESSTHAGATAKSTVQPFKSSGPGPAARVRSSIASRPAGTPRKLSGHTSRRASNIGPIRSAKKNRSISFIDPPMGDTSVTSTSKVTSSGSPPLSRKAGRAPRSSLQQDAGKKQIYPLARGPVGISERIAAVRARRDSAAAAAPGTAESGRSFDLALNLGGAATKPPIWK